ncbi:MAG: hypothetical protein JW755_05580 [Candidatus Aminicenantes bacterium]|nr:hypothetical protein [Candidatus Aminicenantes bacterium]
MDEKGIFDCLEKLRIKDKDFSKKEIFVRVLSNSLKEKGITKITQKLAPYHESGMVEDVTIELINQPDCGCKKEIEAKCGICGFSVCEDHKKYLSVCERCGMTVCKKHTYSSFIDKNIHYCAKCRFSMKRLFWK